MGGEGRGEVGWGGEGRETIGMYNVFFPVVDSSSANG